MAFQYWSNQGTPRTKIIALDGSYHGDTFGAMSVGERSIFTEPFKQLLFKTEFLTFPSPDDEEKCWQEFVALVESDSIAAFIFEPLLQGAAGMRMYRPGLLDKMIAHAQKKGIVCIADEVLTGFGRTGKLFATDYMQNKPDIIALSKGLTGGTMPLGVTSCSEKILQAFFTSDFDKTFFHGHSYTANPLACAAANASFGLLMSSETQEAIAKISSMHNSFVQRLQSRNNVKDARCLGTVCALELKNEETSSYQNSLRKKIYPYFLERSILLRPLGNIIYILPPYVIKEQELRQIYEAIEEFLDER
jgi:adenosylmethionine-8-amino-7-oxononanoate aminotransferase